MKGGEGEDQFGFDEGKVATRRVEQNRGRRETNDGVEVLGVSDEAGKIEGAGDGTVSKEKGLKREGKRRRGSKKTSEANSLDLEPRSNRVA